MNTTELRQLYQDYLVPTYNFSAPIIVRGSGSRVWDIDGKRYLDFTTGISVNNLGHCPPRVVAAIAAQAAELMHCSNIFCNANTPRLAKALSDASFGGKIFFCNSGAEANEGMIKTARLWGNAHGGRNRILCFSQSFHGRTLTTLAATGQPVFREGMEPQMEGFDFAPYNDLEAAKAAVGDRTCAVMLEPLQGEGGVFPAKQEFLRGLRRLCDEKGLLLLLDEVQCGMGRTGTMFAYQQYGIKPDAMSMAKAMGNGIPLAAFELTSELAALFKPGITHGSTFGGTPLATAAGLAVMETFREEDVLAKAARAGARLKAALEALKPRHACLKEVRGLGLLSGLEVGDCVKEAVKACQEKGLLVLTAGKGVMRLLPSLLVTDEEIDEAVSVIDAALP